VLLVAFKLLVIRLMSVLLMCYAFTGVVQDGSIKPVSETSSVIAERLEENELQVCSVSSKLTT